MSARRRKRRARRSKTDRAWRSCVNSSSGWRPWHHVVRTGGRASRWWRSSCCSLSPRPKVPLRHGTTTTTMISAELCGRMTMAGRKTHHIHHLLHRAHRAHRSPHRPHQCHLFLHLDHRPHLGLQLYRHRHLFRPHSLSLPSRRRHRRHRRHLLCHLSPRASELALRSA